MSMVGDSFPDGFTVYDAKGSWRGPDGRTVSEDTIIVEIVASPDDAEEVRYLARWYAWANGQDAVMVMAEHVAVEFINGKGD